MLIDNNPNPNKNNRFHNHQIVERRLNRCDTLPAIPDDNSPPPPPLPQSPSLNINDQINVARCKHVLMANHQQRPQTLPRKVNQSCDLLRSHSSFNENHHKNQTTMLVAKTSSTTNMSDVIVGPLEQCSINATMTIRRLLQLYDSGEYREAANIIARLPYQTFRTVVLELPVDLFVEAIPSSLPILDALYAKAFFSGRDLLAFGFKYLHPENVVSHMIKMFAICDVYAHSGSHESISICKKLLKVILIADPSLRKQLLIKKALIDRAVEGMGHHGLVGTSNDALMNLHEALKLEFERVIQQYKGAIAKIDELSLTTKTIKDGGPITRSLSQGPAPTFSSHQRLLSLKQEELQDRLNKNRSLLCALEPCFRTNHSLQILLAILQKRIDYDKETLFQFGQLSKEYSSASTSTTSTSSSPSSSSSTNGTSTPNTSHHHHHHRHPPSTTSTSSSSSSMATSVARQRSLLSNQFERDSVVAPVLMRFSHGCNQVLNLLKEIQHETTTLTTTTTETDDQQQQPQQPGPMTAKCLSSYSASMSGTMNVSSSSSSADTMLESLDKMTKSANCCLSSSTTAAVVGGGGGNNLLSSSIGRNDPGNQEQNNNNNNNCHQQQQQQQQQQNNNNITVTDDSSDISGYHSDSDMSPISTQSPLATNNRLLIIANSVTNQQARIAQTQQQQQQQQRSNVAIMTGQPDGTTLLAGEVTVNCGGSGNVGSNLSSSLYNQQNMSKDSLQQKAYVVGNSICRIEIDGKPAAAKIESTDVDNDDNDVIDDPDDDRYIQSSLTRQLNNAQEMIEQLKREQLKLKEKLNIQSKQLLMLNTGSGMKQFKFETLDQTHLSTNELIKHYEYLYSQVRVDVIDALDQFDELKDSNELKIKLLFSIVVLANRSTEQTFKEVFSRIGNLLQISNVSMRTSMDINSNDNRADDLNTIYEDINHQIGKYLRSTSAYFDLEPNVQNVCTQIWDTLYDFPCLIKCEPLIDFIRRSIRFCWHLHVQQNQYQIDIETKQFKNEWHCRSIGSDSTSLRIKSYVWPTLFQHGICVHKGVVIT